jgi:hypothetical protein
MTFSNRFPMTTRRCLHLTVSGFTIGYVALMFLLISLTSPHFDGYRHIAVPLLGAMAVLGAALIGVARVLPNRSEYP